MRKMSLIDSFFLINESRRTPMHVASVSLFSLPRGIDDTEFLSNLREVLRTDEPLRHPFGNKLKTGPLGTLGPIYWQPDEELDFDYHIRHSALPKPGRYRELFALASRLHGTLMDRSRPLWELHLIEGLQSRQFATYFKMHHSAIDGVGSMHLVQSMFSASSRTRIQQSPFSQAAFEKYRQQLNISSQQPVEPRENEILAVAEFLREQMGGAVNVANALRRYAGVWMGMSDKLTVPWRQVPKTRLNTQITGARRFVAQSWPIARFKAIGKAFDGTLNDAVLAVCAGALRLQLQEQQALPDHSLKAMAPISLRTKDDLDSGNAVAFITADLGTNEIDPAKRMRVIKDSMRAGKKQLQGMSAREALVYTAITNAPMLILTLAGLASKFPAFSTVISNVPGPRQPMYWNGARLDGMYPVSIPFDGFAVNITLLSNNDMLDFGIVACRHSVPQIQHLIDHIETALQELELAGGISTQQEPSSTISKKGRKVPLKKKVTKKKVAKKSTAKKATRS
ncbi:MAG: wax ester/triacylglycerol synthase family O-acyltransferase [Xanthomonadales bacterium]|nr:wax ester/triacylglycerol synthase family O-acyltransferase [Xanthomonadales bacterium]